MSTHTFLVAFQVTGASSRQEAEQALRRSLPRPDSALSTGQPGQDDDIALECWWVAEDDRSDGSDNDSAVFVDPGAQQVAYNLLRNHGATASCNNPARYHDPSIFER